MWKYSPESEREARVLREEYLVSNPARDDETVFEFRARIREYVKSRASEQLLREMKSNERYIADASKRGVMAG